MDREQLVQTRQWVQEELTRCIDFWEKNGIDKQHGGVYTCLDRKGEIYSTDKSVWMQGRCAWVFAYLCHVYGVRKEWLDISKNCLDFMEAYCINRSAGDRMYFTVTEDGKPLRQRRYYFSEAFYAIANAEYYGITGEAVYLERARRAFDMYWNLAHGGKDPVGMGPKTIPETRSGRSFGMPMTILNVISILQRVDPTHEQEYSQRADQCIEEILKYHVKPELKCILENVAVDGSARLDITEGRIVNPGHDIEGVWFILEYAKRTGKQELVAAAAQIFDWAMELGWDDEYGGLLYFVDCLGKPTEAYEHDMKLWWPHNEILIASIMLYRDTKNEKYLNWFYRVLEYSKNHFSDPEYGEWYGYLRRDGLPTMPSTKGSTFKGPFHLPRCLITVDQIIGEILESQ